MASVAFGLRQETEGDSDEADEVGHRTSDYAELRNTLPSPQIHAARPRDASKCCIVRRQRHMPQAYPKTDEKATVSNMNGGI